MGAILKPDKKRRWSKLQKALYNIVDPDMKFEIHCSVFWKRSCWLSKKNRGKEYVPRFWITLKKEIIWDFPAMFLEHETLCRCGFCSTIKNSYDFSGNYTWVAETIRAYLDTPKEQLLTASFEDDKYGFVDIIRAVDRRIGQERRKPYIENMRRAKI